MILIIGFLSVIFCLMLFFPKIFTGVIGIGPADIIQRQDIVGLASGWPAIIFIGIIIIIFLMISLRSKKRAKKTE